VSKLSRKDIRQLYQSIKLGGPVKLAKLFEESNKIMSEPFNEDDYYMSVSICKIFKSFNIKTSSDNYYEVKWFLKRIGVYRC